MKTLTWQEVFEVHRQIRAIHFENGKIKSMLFSTDGRRNRINYKKGKSLFFCFIQNAAEAGKIANTMKVGDELTVYEKLAPDVWVNIGKHKCVNIGNGKDKLNRDSFVVEVKL